MRGFVWGTAARTPGQREDIDSHGGERRGEGGGESKGEATMEEGLIEEGEGVTEMIEKVESTG